MESPMLSLKLQVGEGAVSRLFTRTERTYAVILRVYRASAYWLGAFSLGDRGHVGV